MQDALLDAELISINVLYRLSLNLLGFCVLLSSLHLILHHLISFSPQLKQKHICSLRTVMHSGPGCHFYRQFQDGWNGKTSLDGHFHSDVEQIILNSSCLLGSPEADLEAQNPCGSSSFGYWLKEMWGGKVHGHHFGTGKQAVHCRFIITGLTWCTITNIYDPQVSSLDHSV